MVKIFERFERGESIDDDINAWLAENPGVTVREIELNSHLIDSTRGLPVLAVVCLVLYDET